MPSHELLEKKWPDKQLIAGSGITIVDTGITKTISAAAGIGLSGITVLDFGSGSTKVDAVGVTVLDPGVTLISVFLLSAYPRVTRELDEMELGPVVVGAGTIVAGVSFNLLLVSVDGDAEGQYTISYARI